MYLNDNSRYSFSLKDNVMAAYNFTCRSSNRTSDKRFGKYRLVEPQQPTTKILKPGNNNAFKIQKKKNATITFPS